MMGITHPQDETTAADPQDAGAGATHPTAIHTTAEKRIACPQVDTITTAFQAVGAVAPCVTTLMGNTCLQVDAITTAPQAAGTVSPCVTAMMGMARAATSLMAMTAVASSIIENRFSHNSPSSGHVHDGSTYHKISLIIPPPPPHPSSCSPHSAGGITSGCTSLGRTPHTSNTG